MLDKKNRIRLIIVAFIIFSFIFQIFFLYPINQSSNSSNKSLNYFKEYNHKKNHLSAEESYSEQWLKNPNFSDTIDPWFNRSEGDLTDVNATSTPGIANFEVLGDSYTFSNVSGVPQASDWGNISNPAFPVKPDSYIINEQGCRVEHTWDENENQTRNTPSARWKRIFELPINMSDYIITSASLNASFNASVETSPAHNGIDTPNDGISQFGIGDYARFYVLISDVDQNQEYQVAYNQTRDLGQDTGPEISNYADTLMNTVPEDILIAFLTSALVYDNFNFSIILGIDIYCEDNIANIDEDRWTYLIIREVNLTFTCEKRIDQLTSVSWNQIGDKINDRIVYIPNASVDVTNATLNFKYKIDQNWTESSPNSEIRILINERRHIESKKLVDYIYSSSFQEAKSGGFDVTSLILKDFNITVSIQVFLADEFGLDRNITISIDDVYLDVSYTITYPDKGTNLQLFLNGEDKTLNPLIELPIGRNLNITVKYTDDIGEHMEEAEVKLIGEGLTEDFTENTTLKQFSIIINTTEKLSIKDNFLTIVAQQTNYQIRTINPIATVRRINTEIIAVNGSNKISIKPGENVNLSIVLNDLDFNRSIKGAVVTYTSELGQGVLLDVDNNGIYEGVIENVPEGSYSIIITAFASDNYEFESYEITLNAIRPIEPDWTWLIFVLVGAIIGLITIFGLYQLHFKYPPMVRKIRKLRKKIRKGKKAKPILIYKRENIIKNQFQNQLQILKVEPEQSDKTSKVEKISQDIKVKELQKEVK